MGTTIPTDNLDSKIKQLNEAIATSAVDQGSIAEIMNMGRTLLNMKLRGKARMTEQEYEDCLRIFQRLSVEALANEAKALNLATQTDDQPTSAIPQAEDTQHP